MAKTDQNRRTFVVRAGTAVAATTAAGALLTRNAAAEVPTSGLPPASEVLADDRPLHERDLLELAALLHAGETTSVALTQAYLDRIEALDGPMETYADNGALNAYVRVDAGQALEDAEEADAILAAASGGGAPAPLLCGVPVAFQDTIAVEGLALQNGTPAFAGNLGVQDALVVARLREQGAVVLGLTTCTPFAGLVDGEPVGACARNPWDGTKDTGGAAEGSAVAAVAGLAAAAFAADHGGSVITSAAATGASAIVPSLGLLPLAGVTPDRPDEDGVGVLATSIAGASLAINGALGPDVLVDPVTGGVPSAFPLVPITPRPTDDPLAGLTLGLPTGDPMLVSGTLAPGDARDAYPAPYRAVLERFAGELEALGATVKAVDGLPDEPAYYGDAVARGAVTNAVRSETRHTVAVRDWITAANVPAAQADVLTAHYGAGEPPTLAGAISAQNAITWGTRVDAERARREDAEAAREALAADGVDALLVLTFGGPPGARGAAPAVRRAELDRASVLGWPSVSLPIGEVDGLPVSATLIGPRLSDPEIVQAAVDYQDRHPEHHTRRPAL